MVAPANPSPHPTGTGIWVSRAKARDPIRDRSRREKIAAAKRGKPRPAHVVTAVAAAHRGTRHSAEVRRTMSEAQCCRGARPPRAGRPWTAEEDALVKALPAKDAGRRTGRTLGAVYDRRRVLGMPDGRTRAAKGTLA